MCGIGYPGKDSEAGSVIGLRPTVRFEVLSRLYMICFPKIILLAIWKVVWREL